MLENMESLYREALDKEYLFKYHSNRLVPL